MAFTYTDFKVALRDMFGWAQTVVSTDAGGNVKDHAGRVSQRYIMTQFPTNATATNLLDNSIIFIAEEECDVVSIRCAAESAVTTSASDYVTFTVLKRKSPTFSVTEAVATFQFGRTSLYTVNLAGTSKSFTIATTSSVIDMDPGDTLGLMAKLVAPAVNAIGRPALGIMVAVEEK
jgi:hypothetical protein